MLLQTQVLILPLLRLLHLHRRSHLTRLGSKGQSLPPRENQSLPPLSLNLKPPLNLLFNHNHNPKLLSNHLLPSSLSTLNINLLHLHTHKKPKQYPKHKPNLLLLPLQHNHLTQKPKHEPSQHQPPQLPLLTPKPKRFSRRLRPSWLSWRKTMMRK